MTIKEQITIYEDIIFRTPALVADKLRRETFNPSVKVKKFEVDEDEIIQEGLL
jgi:hypothetical protein